MSWITLNFEFLTPCFIRGSRQSASAETLANEIVRPPSLIGNWRFWLRAFLGAGQDFRERESLLFGDVRQGQGLLRVRPGKSEGKARKKESFLSEDPGVLYLGYGAIDRDGKLERPAVPVDASFSVDLSVVPMRQASAGEQERAWEDLRTALWLWQTFGGVGARSRRGWGSVQVSSIENAESLPGSEPSLWNEWLATPFPGNHNERKQAVFGRLREICAGQQLEEQGHSLFAGTADPTAPSRRGESDFSNLSSFCAVVPSHSADDWESVLGWLGGKMKAVRSNALGCPHPPGATAPQDLEAVRDLLMRNIQPPHAPYRTAFGMPHNYYLNKGRIKPSFGERRASPVLLQVVRSGKQLAPVVLWLKARLGTQRVPMSGEWDGEDIHGGPFEFPDWSAVVEFLGNL